MSSKDVRTFVEQRRDALEQALELPLLELYGCGDFGCVYRTTEGRVVKLSSDEDELAAWIRIVHAAERRGYDELPGVPRVEHIELLTPVPKDSATLFVIVREDVHPLDQYDIAVARRLERAFTCIEVTPGAIPARASMSDRARYLEMFDTGFASFRAHALRGDSGLVIERARFVETIHRLLLDGMELEDVRARNLGIRRGGDDASIVLLDPMDGAVTPLPWQPATLAL